MNTGYLNKVYRKDIAIKNDILIDDVLCVLFKMIDSDFVDQPVFHSTKDGTLGVVPIKKSFLEELFASIQKDERLYFYLNDSSIFWQFGTPNETEDYVRVASSKNTVNEIHQKSEQIRKTSSDCLSKKTWKSWIDD